MSRMLKFDELDTCRFAGIDPIIDLILTLNWQFQVSALPVPTNSATRSIILEISSIVPHSNFMSHQ